MHIENYENILWLNYRDYRGEQKSDSPTNGCKAKHDDVLESHY